MKKHWQIWLALFLIGIFVFMALASPVLAPQVKAGQYSPLKLAGQITDMIPHPPSSDAILGTTPQQFDVFYTIVWGSRNALIFGLSVALISALLGTLIGVVSAYWGGAANRISMSVTDAFLTFPVIGAVVFVGMIFTMLYTNSGMYMSQTTLGEIVFNPIPGATGVSLNLLQSVLFSFLVHVNRFALAIIMFSWMPYARIINNQVTRIKQAEYVIAAQATGVRNRRIILRHLLPNSISPAVVLAARDVGSMVVLQATFTYIGLGGDSPWGQLLAIGNKWILGPGGSLSSYWWVYLPATIAIILFGLGWNLLGDELNNLLNPREK
jgi:peptide/nickel transport system permease protein